MFNYQTLAKKHRFEGLLGLLAMFGGVFATVASVTVVTAQNAFEFEDPLDELREKLGMAGSEAGEGSGIADQTATLGGDGAGGMSSFGLFAIAAAILLALVIGLVWWLGRNRRARIRAQDSERDVYVTDDYSPPRHALESGSTVTRERSGRIDTREDFSGSKSLSDKSPLIAVAAPTAGASAAMILSDEADQAEGQAEFKETSDSKSRNDPDSWNRPNLDRLKDSIREDWPGRTTATASAAISQKASAMSDGAKDKVSAAREAVSTEVDDFHSDDDTFNAMFGDDATPVEHAASQDTSFADQIEDIATGDASQAARELEASANESVTASVPSRNDALKRIKALRESVKAG